MTDKNGTTTTMWQDNHSALRRHKLMTKESQTPSRPCTPMTEPTTPTPSLQW